MLNISGDSDTLLETAKGIAADLEESRGSADGISERIDRLSRSMEESAAAISHVTGLIDTIVEAFREMAEEIARGTGFAGQIRTDAERTGANAVEEKDRVTARLEQIEAAVDEKIERSKRCPRSRCGR